MESKYNYFKRDISWLSFNYRVLLEALDEHLPLYERINFISIYSSNLEEFYKIRVADHKAVASGATESDEETVQSARELVEEINHEVNRQLDDRVRIYEEKILPALRKTTSSSTRTDTWNRFTSSLSRTFPGRNLPLPATRARIERQNRLFSARQPALPRHPPLSEGKRKPRQPTAFLLRHETAVRQSAPFHRTSAPWKQLLHHVHRGHHQSEPQPYFPRLRRRFELLHQNIP